jgi:hypothetical protein
MFKRNAKGGNDRREIALEEGGAAVKPCRSLEYQPSPLRGFQRRVHIRTEACGLGQATAGRFA